MIRVTTEDLDTGAKEVLEFSDDYVLICAGGHYLAGLQWYNNGTHVLTVKRGTPTEARDFSGIGGVRMHANAPPARPAA